MTPFYIVKSLTNCGRLLSISEASHGQCLVRLSPLFSWEEAGLGARNRDRWKIIPACMWWTIWRERNTGYLEDGSTSVRKIKLNWKFLSCFWCTKAYYSDDWNNPRCLKCLPVFVNMVFPILPKYLLQYKFYQIFFFFKKKITRWQKEKEGQMPRQVKKISSKYTSDCFRKHIGKWHTSLSDPSSWQKKGISSLTIHVEQKRSFDAPYILL